MISSKNLSLFAELLTKNKEWLLGKITDYADKLKYSRYPTSFEKEWHDIAETFSSSLIKTAESFNFSTPEISSDDSSLIEPISDFGKTLVRKNRELGLPVSKFMKLIKCYRKAYTDLLNESDLNPDDRDLFKYFTDSCFDHIEIAYVNEWSVLKGNDLVKEMENTTLLLTNEKNKYLTLFEDYYSPLIVLDSDNKILNLNQAASQLFVDMHIKEYISTPENKENKEIVLLEHHLNDFIKSSLPELAYETFMKTKFGERFFLVKLKKLTNINNTIKGTVIILDDLTERKEMEHQFELAKTKAEEADKLKTAFLANMSHEIRTPMNAIIGFSDLMLKENLDKNQIEYLRLIQKSGNNLLKLIDDIIDIAKIESKQLKIKIVECNILEVLNDLYSVFEELIKKENKEAIELRLVTDKLITNNVKTDPERLKQVFTNLLSNSLKFTDTGYIEFGFKTINKKKLVFYVKDTGIGIPKNKLKCVFERFYQVEDSYTKDYGGTGLGLSITKNIVNLLGGNIWVESELNVGTTFYFIIPINNEADKLAKPGMLQVKSDPFRNTVLKNHKILIAEDEEINFYYLNEILKSTGVKVLWAKNGLEAINLTESNPDIDLVLMDIKMPEINGLEAIRYLKSIRPDLPIVAQTAFVMGNDRDICIKAGCVDFLSKPIKSSQLLEVITKVLSSENKLVIEETSKKKG